MIELEDILTVAMRAKGVFPNDDMSPILTVELVNGDEIFTMLEGDQIDWAIAMAEIALQVGPIAAVAFVAEASISTYRAGEVPDNPPSPLDDLGADNCLLAYRVDGRECRVGVARYGRGDHGELLWKDGPVAGGGQTVEPRDDLVVGVLRAMVRPIG